MISPYPCPLLTTSLFLALFKAKHLSFHSLLNSHLTSSLKWKKKRTSLSKVPSFYQDDLRPNTILFPYLIASQQLQSHFLLSTSQCTPLLSFTPYWIILHSPFYWLLLCPIGSLVFFFFLQDWGLNSGSTPWATPLALFCVRFLEIGSHKRFAQTAIQLISAS
jgi:hypothetical protein